MKNIFFQGNYLTILELHILEYVILVIIHYYEPLHSRNDISMYYLSDDSVLFFLKFLISYISFIIAIY